MEFKNKKLEQFEKDIEKKENSSNWNWSKQYSVNRLFAWKKAEVSVFDDREEDKISKDILEKLKKYNFKCYFGKRNLDNLYGFYLIFRSPSCLPTKPELEKEAQRGAIITTEIEQLIKMAPCKVIGITGSDGKQQLLH